MSLKTRTLRELDEAIRRQFAEKTLGSGLQTAMAVLALLGVGKEREIEEITLTKLQLPNAERYDHWFQPHPYFRSDRSCFELVDGSELPLQAKFYWLQKKSKLSITGGVHFTPNWEDGEFTRAEGYKVGVDFFLTPNAESILVVLSDRGNLRIVELTERLRTTQVEIFTAWTAAGAAGSADILHATLWKTFQLQAVNEKFYIGVANAFTELVQHLETSVEILSEADSKQFANRLIGRLLFCWFLRKRSILDPEQKYFDIEELSATEYYRSRLEPLFFLTLNTPVSERPTAIERFIAVSGDYLPEFCQTRVVTDLKTPYLNGGLFESHESDHFATSLVTFPDGYFQRLFEHFDSYNFTTDESSPEFEQVAIDPEMLGKVFESLLATQVDGTGDQARQAIGAFYTPRNIVSYMCTEAVRTVLSEKFDDNKKALNAIDSLLNTPDAQWASYGTNSRRDALKGFEKQLLHVLREITILDPACGSGAFPMGMLQLLVKLHLRLTSELEPYEIKMHFLEKSLFGTDIEPMAIEISKLRAWLTLIVDQENSNDIDSLPNLDFHFICCNSLIKLKAEDSNTFSFFGDSQIDIATIKNEYFFEANPGQKKRLQERYEVLLKERSDAESDRLHQLITFHPFNADSPAVFFDREEMFGMADGFDVVISNPPYVRQERIKYKNEISNYEVYTSTADLYTYFFEMGLSNLKSKGILSFITSSKYGRALYGEKLRRMLSESATLDYVIDYGQEHVFTAMANTWVIQARKKEPLETSHVLIFRGINGNGDRIPQSQLSAESWSFGDEQVEVLNGKIKNAGPPISALPYKMYQGIKTGMNLAFLIDAEIRRELIDKDPKNGEIIRPILKGRDITRFRPKEVGTWLLATKNEFNVSSNYPDIASYLTIMNERYEGKVAKRGDKGVHWMNLRDCAYYQEMDLPKIVWPELSNQNKFALVESGEYILNTADMLTGPDLHYILAILNSKVIGYYFQHVSNSSGMGTTQWRQYAVEQLPIPPKEKVPPKTLSELIDLVERRCNLNLQDSLEEASTLEERMNGIVYGIFKLTPEDIEFIEESFPS